MNRKKQPPKPEVTRETEYYKLHTKAIQDLAEADESNSPEVSEQELRKYRSGPKLKVADWVKLLLVKFWFAGSVCFFFLWGLGGYLADLLDTLLVTGIALGIVTDLLTNNALRFLETTKGASDRWIMVTKRGYASFPLNILYAFIVLFLVYSLYNIINIVIISITGAVDTVALGVEPILFGLFYLGFDLLLIRCKHLILNAVHKGGK
jgi:hypothetical protein